MSRKYYIYIDKVIDDIIKTVKKSIKYTDLDFTFMDEFALALHDAGDMMEITWLLAQNDLTRTKRKFYKLEEDAKESYPKSFLKLIKATKNDVIVESEKWNDLLFGEREARLEDIERDFN